MNDESPDNIERLIRDGYGVPAPSAEFVDRLEGRLHTRLRTSRAASQRTIAWRRAVLVAAAMAAVIALVLLLPADRSGVPPTVVETPSPGLSQREVAALEHRLVVLDEEVRVRQRIARLIESRTARRSRLASLRGTPPRPDPLVIVSRQVDRSAEVLVRQADRLRREGGLDGPAAERYRLAARLFPESPWAVVARQRLAEINKG